MVPAPAPTPLWPPAWVGQRAVWVVGLGRSGVAAAEALLAAGGPRALTVIERQDTTAVRERADALPGGAELVLGDVAYGEVAARTGQPDLVVVSPGVRPTNPVLAGALDAGVAVWSEPELAWQLNARRTRLVVVTGTNGKTSTTELLGACLGAPTAGNIGDPLSALVAADTVPPVVVVELSSFQLQFTRELRPSVALLLNFAPDHLDWHADVDEYAAAKAHVWARQQPEDWAVVNLDDPGAGHVVATHPPPGRQLGFTLDAPRAGQIGVAGGAITARVPGREPVALGDVHRLSAPGPHNLSNALAAAGGALCAGANPDTIIRALTAFRPGPHRLEWVATVDGVAYVDDSKATNPHAAAAALASYDSVVWIAGGLAKGLSFEPLAAPIRQRVRAAVTIGSGGPEIAGLARRLGVRTVEAGTLDAAVAAAARLARAGDTVLLAPACASMDQFDDYADRGRAFQAAVRRLHDEEEPDRVR